VLISQGSSEHSICCAVPREQADRAVATVRAAFARELDEGQIQSVEIDRELAILAVVGDGMAGIPGIAAKVFNALGHGGGQRAGDRAGCLRTQHLRGGTGQGRNARAAGRALELLSFR
jgi:hypothetical protein